jgi:anti-anti-sigma factor
VGSDMGKDRLSDSLTGDELAGQPPLSISSRRNGARAVLDIDGELDLAGTERLIDEARDLLATGATISEVDATRVTFIDSAGLTALLAIQSDATAAGIAFAVAAASDVFLRTVDLAGLRDQLSPSD